MCNGISPVEDIKEQAPTQDDLVHTGVGSWDFKIGDTYITYCGIRKTITILTVPEETAKRITCPTCIMKFKSFHGY